MMLSIPPPQFPAVFADQQAVSQSTANEINL